MRHGANRTDAQAQRDAEALPKAIRARIYRVVQRLRQWPDVSGAKPLRGALVGHFRIRTGDYRIQFRVVGERLCIERIGHRDGFYEP